MSFKYILFFELLGSACSSAVVRNDISDINPKDKSVVEIIKLLTQKGYRCNNVEPTKYEINAFMKSKHEINKYSCVKQIDTTFCVDSHFVYLYQDKNTKDGLLLNGNTSPTCIWTK